MFSTVFNTLLKGPLEGTLERFNEQGFEKGRHYKTYDAGVTVSFYTVPDRISNIDLQAEDGAQVLDNRHFYFIGSDFDISNYDRLTYDSATYELRGVEPRLHGNFTYVYGRNVERNEGGS